MTTKSLKLDDTLIEQIEAKAKQENRTFSGYVRHVLSQAVREREATLEEKKALEEYYRERTAGIKTTPVQEFLDELENN